MISYSVKAIRGLAHFFQPFNDIDVYVEDTKCRNFYVILINRILDGKAKVLRVFQLGGRDLVIDACSRDQNNNVRRRIYIIDGDFDLLLGRHLLNLNRLYRLNVYCSENLIMCKEAVHQIGIEYMPNDDKNVIVTTIDYDGFIREIEVDLLELFFVYALAYQTDRSIVTVGLHVYQMCDSANGPSQLDHQLVEQKRDELIARLNTFYTIDGTRERIEEIRKRCQDNGYQGVHMISGKNYLLPLLWAHLKRTIRYRSNMDTVFVQLARHVRLDIDTGLANAINITAKGLLYRQST